MSSKRTFFIANWKMNGNPDSLKEVVKVHSFFKNKLKKTNKLIVFCPPLPLIALFSKNIKSNFLKFGAQDFSSISEISGAYTGSVSANILKQSGSEYVIIGHSEKRDSGDTYKDIKKKILIANKNNLKIIFCFGEKLKDKKNNKSIFVIKKQIMSSMPSGVNFKNIIFAYEPVWSIGTGLIPSKYYLTKIFHSIKKIIKDEYSLKHLNLLYGGSVNSKNIKNLSSIPGCNGYLIGGASLKSKDFIEIIENYYS